MCTEYIVHFKAFKCYFFPFKDFPIGLKETSEKRTTSLQGTNGTSFVVRENFMQNLIILEGTLHITAKEEISRAKYL